MSTLHRITYIDHKGCVTNEWRPTVFTADDRIKELDVLGMESIDVEEMDVPWDHLADLIHWLNTTPNSPPIKDGTMSTSTDAAENEIDRVIASTVRPSALESQVGGDHYKKLGAYQPWEVLRHWLTPEEFRGFMKGQAIAYLARERDKGGDQDVAKAEHQLRGLLELIKG